jgi:plasmid stability protein
MVEMPTLHIRNVPDDVYRGLKERADREGRSLNSEAIAILRERLELDRGAGNVFKAIKRLAREIDLPHDAPAPEEIIREARDAR